MRYVKWVEPFISTDSGDEPVYMRVSERAAIAHQKAVARQSNHEYGSDAEALEDFITVHWAEFCTENG